LKEKINISEIADEWRDFAGEFADRIIEEAQNKIMMSTQKNHCSSAIITGLIHATAVVVMNVVEKSDHERITTTLADYLKHLEENEDLVKNDSNN